MASHIKPRQGTATLWTSTNPTPLDGEKCRETDTKRTKTGDGATAYNSLAYDLTRAELGLLATGIPKVTTGTGAVTIATADDLPTGQTAQPYIPATGAQTVTLLCSSKNQHDVIGHAEGTAITFAISGPTNNQVFIVSILQGAVVSTIAAWFATIRWAGGSAPTLTAVAGKRDTFGFRRTGANTYDGFVIGQGA